MIKPWEKKGEPVVIASQFGKKLVKQMYCDPSGKEHEFVLFGQKDWSVVLPVTYDGKVIVVRQFKQGCNKVIGELPAGTADFGGESPEEVMRRELREETGYEAEEIFPLGHGWIATRNSWTKFHCFLATGCRRMAEQKLDATEDIETYFLSLRQWISMITDGIVEEPSAIVTTFRALPRLGLKVEFLDQEYSCLYPNL